MGIVEGRCRKRTRIIEINPNRITGCQSGGRFFCRPNWPWEIWGVSLIFSGEDVLATYTGVVPNVDDIVNGDFGRNAWVFQEKWKGRSSFDTFRVELP